MESMGVAGSKECAFTKTDLLLLVGIAESWVRGIPALKEQREQPSPLQNQILLLAPWILRRGEVCEAQGHLALHGNKVSLLSHAFLFLFSWPSVGSKDHCMFVITTAVVFSAAGPWRCASRRSTRLLFVVSNPGYQWLGHSAGCYWGRPGMTNLLLAWTTLSEKELSQAACKIHS